MLDVCLEDTYNWDSDLEFLYSQMRKKLKDCYGVSHLIFVFWRLDYNKRNFTIKMLVFLYTL